MQCDTIQVNDGVDGSRCSFAYGHEGAHSFETQALADAQALADVRTLDDWARANRDQPPLAPRLHYPSEGGWYIHGPAGLVFEGDTPDEARAKAAAWVREQAKGAPVSATSFCRAPSTRTFRE